MRLDKLKRWIVYHINLRQITHSIRVEGKCSEREYNISHRKRVSRSIDCKCHFVNIRFYFNVFCAASFSMRFRLIIRKNRCDSSGLAEEFRAVACCVSRLSAILRKPMCSCAYWSRKRARFIASPWMNANARTLYIINFITLTPIYGLSYFTLLYVTLF